MELNYKFVRSTPVVFNGPRGSRKESNWILFIGSREYRGCDAKTFSGVMERSHKAVGFVDPEESILHKVLETIIISCEKLSIEGSVSSGAMVMPQWKESVPALCQT